VSEDPARKRLMLSEEAEAVPEENEAFWSVNPHAKLEKKDTAATSHG